MYSNYFKALCHYFYNIPYANGLQFTKVSSTKLPTVLIRPTFLPPSFFTIRYMSRYGKIVLSTLKENVNSITATLQLLHAKEIATCAPYHTP